MPLETPLFLVSRRPLSGPARDHDARACHVSKPVIRCSSTASIRASRSWRWSNASSGRGAPASPCARRKPPRSIRITPLPAAASDVCGVPRDTSSATLLRGELDDAKPLGDRQGADGGDELLDGHGSQDAMSDGMEARRCGGKASLGHTVVDSGGRSTWCSTTSSPKQCSSTNAPAPAPDHAGKRMRLSMFGLMVDCEWSERDNRRTARRIADAKLGGTPLLHNPLFQERLVFLRTHPHSSLPITPSSRGLRRRQGGRFRCLHSHPPPCRLDDGAQLLPLGPKPKLALDPL